MKATDIFQFDKNIPPEIKPSIEANLDRLKFLIPSWCHLVYVYYVTDPNDKNLAGGAVASSSCSYSYRSGCIFFHPSYFQDSECERMNTCIHELLHLSVNLLGDYASNEIELLLPDENSPHRKSIIKELDNRLESVVVDLAHIVQRQL